MPVASWSRTGEDSVVVSWFNGFAGVTLELRILNDGDLRGTATALSDVVGKPKPQAPAVARRVACTPG